MFGVDLPGFQAGNTTYTDAGADDITLQQALNLGGGGIAALMRQATAALLNSKDEDVTYRYTTDQVKALVWDAFNPGGDYNGPTGYEALKNLFQAQNELGLLG